MKFLQIFNKTPNHKKFNYTPRFYNAEEEEMKERVQRIERELNVPTPQSEGEVNESDYRARIRGGFSRARQANGAGATTSSSSSSPILLRFAILLILTVGFIGYLQYGLVAIYGIALLIIPIFLYLKFRKMRSNGR
jgi:hypothetical protein